MEKRKYYQIENSVKHQFITKQNLKKKEKIPAKEKNKSRERKGHIYQGKRRKLQNDNGNEEMIIKNQRPDIKIVNEKDVIKWYPLWNLSS